MVLSSVKQKWEKAETSDGHDCHADAGASALVPPWPLFHRQRDEARGEVPDAGGGTTATAAIVSETTATATLAVDVFVETGKKKENKKAVVVFHPISAISVTDQITEGAEATEEEPDRECRPEPTRPIW